MVSEAGRLIALSCAVLVAVIAFAAAVKPLADGLLGPVDALRFMTLAIVPMLAYALPFAAGFGATLAYHRMAQDNELLASYAGGISHRSLLVPAAAVGLVLAVGLSVLNEQAIPRFLTVMERMITQDLSQVMVRRLERGKSAEIGGFEISADRVYRMEDPPEGAFSSLLLQGVVAVEPDATGHVNAQMVVETALVSLYRGSELDTANRAAIAPDDTAAVITFRNGTGRLSSTGQRAIIDENTLPPVRIPNPFRDDPKFLTWGELRELRSEPERMNFIDERRRELAGGLASKKAQTDILGALESGRPARFATSSFGQPQEVVLRATDPEPFDGGWHLEPTHDTGRVEVSVYNEATGSIDRFSAMAADLIVKRPESADPTRPAPRAGVLFEVMLFDAELQSSADPRLSADPGLIRKLPEYTLDRLEATGDPIEKLTDQRAATLVRSAEVYTKEGTPDYDPAIAEAVRRLAYDLASLQREITSKQHERMAFAAACFVMVLTGAVTAIRLKHAMPLVVYLWSFFPALFTVILIASGQQTIHGSGAWPFGVPLMWSGVAGLGVYCLLTLRAISRH